MVFAYYNRLSATAKRVYRKSDEIASITLPDAEELRPLIASLSKALEQENREKTEELCRKISASITERLKVRPVRIKVLAARPSRSWGELHGLYVLTEQRSLAVITVWMRTAKFRRVVAFRSFLRTLLHELCHHLDYTLLGMPESYHTEGFYKRESSLFHQLVGKDGEAGEGKKRSGETAKG
jgi:hypothetical protein